MPGNKYHFLLIPMLSLISLYSRAQAGNEQNKQTQYLKLKSIIESKRYQFHANSVTPMKGRTIQLTSEYFLKLNKDSLLSDLPYYGRAYSVDYPGTNISVQFISTQFSYSVDTTKKSGWEITIIPKNEPKASKIYLSVGSAGYCNLRVLSNTRQTISYYGIIKDYD